MADYTAIRTALAASLEPLVTSRQLSQADAYQLSSPSPPCAFVTVGPTTYDGAMGRGHDELTFLVVVLVGFSSDIEAQAALDQMLASSGPTSVKALIQADKRLGGACQTLRVTEATGPRLYALDTTRGSTTAPALGAEWTVEILA